MWPGLRPGERYYLDGERVFKASQLDDRRLQAVPDKEQSMRSPYEVEPYAADPAGARSVEDGKTMPLSDALTTLAETVDGDGRIAASVYDLPAAFFSRDDVEKVNVIVSDGLVHVIGNLVVGGHRFGCFSKGFPMGAE